MDTFTFCFCFFFASRGNTTDLTETQNTRKLQQIPLDLGDEDGAAVDAPLPKLPKSWITGAHHEANGKSSTPPPKRLLPAPPAPPRRSDAPPPSRTHPDPPLPDLAVVTGAAEIRRFPDSSRSRAGRRSSRERHRRRGSTPTAKLEPAAPAPPKLRRPSTYRTLRTLPYIHAVRRAYPTLPLPEQPMEGEEPTPHRWKRWIEGRLSKIASAL